MNCFIFKIIEDIIKNLEIKFIFLEEKKPKHNYLFDSSNVIPKKEYIPIGFFK